MSFDPVEENVTFKPLKIIAKIVKILFGTALILMLGWLCLRSCYQDGTEKMKRYMWTEAAAQLYDENELKVKRLVEYNDPELGRLFFIGHIYYTEDIGQFQFMLRYNTLNELYKDLADENGNAEFRFELTDKNGTHYTEYQYITDSALMYRYFRVAFENVDVTYVDKLYVNIILVTEEEEIDVGSCIVYDKEGPSDDYKLSKAEKNAQKPTKDIVVGGKEK